VALSIRRRQRAQRAERAQDQRGRDGQGRRSTEDHGDDDRDDGSLEESPGEHHGIYFLLRGARASACRGWAMSVGRGAGAAGAFFGFLNSLFPR
jgi:hypothetical protein